MSELSAATGLQLLIMDYGACSHCLACSSITGDWSFHWSGHELIDMQLCVNITLMDRFSGTVLYEFMALCNHKDIKCTPSRKAITHCSLSSWGFVRRITLSHSGHVWLDSPALRASVWLMWEQIPPFVRFSRDVKLIKMDWVIHASCAFCFIISVKAWNGKKRNYSAYCNYAI